ncbi:MAG TPA: branched-chain amino acid ABC transporter permease [Mycobacteriales bacterium]|nr:branched-chain amino acid ABC transporter permease [Mycobacteriales bacterium]
MREFVLSTLSGIASGAVYGLMGLGLVIIYRATDVVNFALASMATTAMLVGTTAVGWGWGVLGGLAAAVLVCSVGGVAVREVLIRPLGSGQLFTALVVTMGVALILDDVQLHVWGGQPRTFPPLVGGEVHIAGAAIQNQQLLTVAVAGVAMLAVGYLFTRTPLGAAMRAVAESHPTAQLLGINPHRIARLAWALGMGLAAVAAGMFTPISGVTIGGLQGSLFFAFTGIFLGGLTSMTGAVVGGLAIGVLANWAAAYVSASFRDTVVFAIAVAVLLLRPQGLFGKQTFERV